MQAVFFQENVSLIACNTFKLNVIARWYVSITDSAQLGIATVQVAALNLPVLVLGGGSNIIFTEDFPGCVVHIAMKGRKKITEDAHFTYIEVQAGEVWHDFVVWTLDEGVGGLENLSGIPGTVGAAPVQNIGAYGVELKDYMHSLTWFEWDTGEVHTFSKEACQFGYRDSIFKRELAHKGVILSVTFKLPKVWQPQLAYGELSSALCGQHISPQTVKEAVCAIRSAKLPDPSLLGNVGSFFKNPLISLRQYENLLMQFPKIVAYPEKTGQYKIAAGWLIEHLGWKGKSLASVGVYEKQALILVKMGHATGREVVTLAKKIQTDVLNQFNIALEVEPVCI